VERGRGASSALVALALAVGAGVLFAVRLDVPGFFDNEGRYAEVAREMVVLRDWVTPYLDFTLFLNKPPLTFWAASLVFAVAGPTEWARVVSVVFAVLTLFATCRLGTLLYGGARADRVGLVAGVMLASTLGFVLEARTLRPDMALTAAVVVALLCWCRAERTDARAGWLAGMYAALGVGVLAKGLVPVIVAGLPIAAVTLRDRGVRGVWRLRPGLGLLVFGAVVLPWHVLVALRHPGFAWDYVVNQHLLFFLDRKLPRDSEGDTLAFFLTAYAGRAIPWVLLLPATLGEAVRGFARGASAAERATFFLWVWVGGLLLFFACAPSRLEHYSIPALPATALLAARAWQRASAGAFGRVAWLALAAVGVSAALAGAVGVVVGRELLEKTYWLAQAPGLLGLAAPAGAVVSATGALTALAAGRRRAGLLVGALALGMAPMVGMVLRAEALAEPLFSWRPAARAIDATVPRDTEVVFESPEEYQLVGGLAYYLGRRVTLLEPPGFVPPTYLRDAAATMFLARGEFQRRWPREPLVFVSDPQRQRGEPSGLVPGGFRVIGQFGDRWVLASTLVPAAR
jgi:4-amino-4-deoxy-L-arabinose transferase-like glycosyltransferase